jgi:hypothetical protein
MVCLHPVVDEMKLPQQQQSSTPGLGRPSQQRLLSPLACAMKKEGWRPRLAATQVAAMAQQRRLQ